MANVWRRIPSGRLTAFSLVRHAKGEATADITSSEFFGFHILTGDDNTQTNISEADFIDLGLLIGLNATQSNTSTTGAMSSGIPKAVVEQMAVRVISLPDPAARMEQLAARVVSSVNPVVSLTQVAVRVVSTVEEAATALTGNNANQPNASTSGAISQTHAVTGNAANQPNASTSGATDSAHTVTGNSANEPNSSTSGAVSSTHTLTGNAANQPNSSTAGALSGTALTANPVQQPNTSSSGAVERPITVRSTPSVQVNRSHNGKITTVSTLQGANCQVHHISLTVFVADEERQFGVEREWRQGIAKYGCQRWITVDGEVRGEWVRLEHRRGEVAGEDRQEGVNFEPRSIATHYENRRASA